MLKLRVKLFQDKTAKRFIDKDFASLKKHSNFEPEMNAE
jgi:hypothetical protein